MGRVFAVTFEGKIYSCKHCGTRLALSEDIVSKSFKRRHGKAYLFTTVFGFGDDRITFLHLSPCSTCQFPRQIQLYKEL